jgi:3-hydroxy-9,10-secoandrosta-1,3,5(10)-triene-9,17-dione monooxygenase
MTTTVEMTREEMLARAEALVPTLAERAQETEDARRIPQETLDAIVEAGFLRITTPVRWGGSGLEYDTAWEIGTILGRGCGSTAWCYMVAAIHNWQMGLAPEQAQEEYFTTPDQLSSSAFAPTGTLEPAEGGWLIHGRWPFSSGVDHARWALLGVIAPNLGPVLLAVPGEDYRIDDDWFVSGLRGTGSKSVVIDEPTFVPAHRYTSISGVPHPEARAAHERASYGAPFMSVLPFTLVSPLIGIAQGMVDEFVQRGLTRRTMTGQLQGEVPAQQFRLAESSAEVDAARALARADLAELIERGARDDEFTVLDRARFRRDHGFINNLCVRAVNRLFDASGGNALYDSSALQRFHRDVNAGSHQIAITWDLAAEIYGRARFGLELAPGIW